MAQLTPAERTRLREDIARDLGPRPLRSNWGATAYTVRASDDGGTRLYAKVRRQEATVNRQEARRKARQLASARRKAYNARVRDVQKADAVRNARERRSAGVIRMGDMD